LQEQKENDSEEQKAKDNEDQKDKDKDNDNKKDSEKEHINNKDDNNEEEEIKETFTIAFPQETKISEVIDQLSKRFFLFEEEKKMFALFRKKYVLQIKKIIIF
jgi:DNA mismatch repair ATPase MutL